MFTQELEDIYIYIICVYLFERQRGREGERKGVRTCWFTHRCLQWLELDQVKSVVGNSAQIPHKGSGDPVLDPSPAASQALH